MFRWKRLSKIIGIVLLAGGALIIYRTITGGSEFSNKLLLSPVGKITEVNQGVAVVYAGEYQLIDINGVVVGKLSSPANYPVIYVEPSLGKEIGQRFDQKNLLWLIRLLPEFKTRGIDPKIFKIKESDEIEFWVADGMRVLMTTQKDALSQLDSLQLIIDRAKIDGEALKNIDVRFGKPITTDGKNEGTSRH